MEQRFETHYLRWIASPQLQYMVRIEFYSIILYIYRFLFRPQLAIFLVLEVIPRMLRE
jgi:hypothetical protein